MITVLRQRGRPGGEGALQALPRRRGEAHEAEQARKGRGRGGRGGGAAGAGDDVEQPEAEPYVFSNFFLAFILTSG